jgi:hypothetical protein
MRQSNTHGQWVAVDFLSGEFVGLCVDTEVDGQPGIELRVPPGPNGIPRRVYAWGRAELFVRCATVTVIDRELAAMLIYCQHLEEEADLPTIPCPPPEGAEDLTAYAVPDSRPGSAGYSEQPELTEVRKKTWPAAVGG